MKFPLQSTMSIGKYVASQQRKGERYPLVLMLEPTLACNIACIGCGKIREYESNRARLSVEECLDAGLQCPAPVVSICGGEPLVFKGIEDVVAGFMELNKNVELCTNALRLEQFMDVFEPNKRLTFVVHLDGMREIHDYICDYPGLWDVAVGAIVQARARGFRVTTNTTIFKETEVEDVIQMMDYLTNADCGIWLACRGVTAVGCILYHPLLELGCAGEVKRLYVQSPFRHRGLAQLLLAWTRTDTFQPAARTLLEPLDQQPGDLLRTLAAYLDAESSLAETAAVLGVHRNTVAGRVAQSASSLYARNLFNFIETMVDKPKKALAVNWDDELVKATALTRDGAVIHPNFQPKA